MMIVSTPDLDFASLLSEVFHELSNATQNLRVRTCPERNYHQLGRVSRNDSQRHYNGTIVSRDA